MKKTRIEIEVDYDENDPHINGPFRPTEIAESVWEDFLEPAVTELFGCYPSVRIRVDEATEKIYNKENNYGVDSGEWLDNGGADV